MLVLPFPHHDIDSTPCNRFGGGFMLYVNENIPCRHLSDHPIFSDLEPMAIEIHQNKRRRVVLGIYTPPSQSDMNLRINQV